LVAAIASVLRHVYKLGLERFVTKRSPLLRQPIGRGPTIAPTKVADFAASFFHKVWLVERLCDSSAEIRREFAPRYQEVSSEWMGALKMTVFSRE